MQVPIEEATSEARTFAKKKWVNHDLGGSRPRVFAFVTPLKFNSSPLKSYRNPIGTACLPTSKHLFFRGDL